MRIWQKIYFLTLVLFLVILNIGLFLASSFIFHYNFRQEQKKTETDCYFLRQNIEHDLSILEQNARYQDNVIDLLFEGYQSYYQTQDVMLYLEKTDSRKSPSLRSEVQDGGNRMTVYAEQNLPLPYDSYRIHYERRLTGFEQTWRDLKRTFSAISLSMSILLCPLLYTFMHRILLPLGRLNESVAKIAAGEYACQAAPGAAHAWSRDEIDELSQNVNKMAATIQQQIEALEHENRQKQQLMDHMAHELKTPLTSIYGYAEYLRYAKTTPEETYEGLSYIMEESKRLTKMSETMLSLRAYENDELQHTPVRMETVASHVEKILSRGLQEKNLTLRKQFETDIIYGDETLFVHLFRNLLENAIRASQTNGEILWSCSTKKNGQTIELTDHGIGMEEDELEKITRAFYRVDKARSRKNGGVGLGLFVADWIVAQFHGTMTFSSAPGKGTTVSIHFTTP